MYPNNRKPEVSRYVFSKNGFNTQQFVNLKTLVRVSTINRTVKTKLNVKSIKLTLTRRRYSNFSKHREKDS